jgi:spoIIIJ-associated protein
MSEYEVTGRTIEEAVTKALTELGIKKENALIEVKDEPSQGILGLLGSKEARVVVKTSKAPKEYLTIFMREVMDLVDVDGSVAVEEDHEKLAINISGQDVGVLIGRRGKTLSDLQYILNVVIRRQFSNLNKMVVLDIENYRVRREKTLTQLAKSIARKVSQEGYEQALEPMSPQERRIIHIALQNYPDVRTYSDGEEPYRKVVVAPI